MDFLKTEREKLAYLYAQYTNAFNIEKDETVRKIYANVLSDISWTLEIEKE